MTEADPNGVTTTYSYDDLNRLTEVLVKNTADNHLIFDQTYTINNHGLRGGDVEKRYDATGTLFSQTALTWTYDADDRLVEEALSVTSGGSNAPAPYDDKFLFDLANDRVGEDIDNGNDGTFDAAIAYRYNGNDELLTELKVSDTFTGGFCPKKRGWHLKDVMS